MFAPCERESRELPGSHALFHKNLLTQPRRPKEIQIGNWKGKPNGSPVETIQPLKPIIAVSYGDDGGARLVAKYLIVKKISNKRDYFTTMLRQKNMRAHIHTSTHTHMYKSSRNKVCRTCLRERCGKSRLSASSTNGKIPRRMRANSGINCPHCVHITGINYEFIPN